MANRTRLLYFFVLASSVIGLAGCAYNQQSKFQSSFLPGLPEAESVDTVAAAVVPPRVQPNLYPHSLPWVVTERPVPPPMAVRAESRIDQAEEAFQRGKKYYQAKDYSSARMEFDAAVDLMLAAGEFSPADRAAYERRLDEMVDAIHRYDLAGLGASEDIEEARFEKAPLEDILPMTFPIDPKLKNKVQEQIRATASQLPLSYNDAVVSYINYFSGRGRKTLIAGLERAGRYRPLIQRILQEEGIPQELIHLAQAESGFLPRAVSRKAAVGMWQFLAWRGQQYGLMQTRYTDDRLDPEKATRAAARHLHDLYNQFGDWYLAVAAYNCGPGTVEKAVERTGYADFWDLRRLGVLPAETTNYVPIILAMTIMEKHAAEYGIEGITPDEPLRYDTLEMSASTHLQLVADLTDTPVSELMALNPSLLKGIVPQDYVLRVPKGMGTSLMASLQLIPAERRSSWRMHTVERGETLAAIGKRYGTAPSRIVEANKLESEVAVAGERLVIPASYQPPAAKATRTARHTTRVRAAARHGARGHGAAAKRKAPALARTAYTARHGAERDN